MSRLAPRDFALLKAHLEPVDLPVRKQLEQRNKAIERVCFVESGLVSVVANGNSQRSIEVGIIGAEGVTGFAVIMGGDRSPNESYVQMAGGGQWMKADELRKAIDKSVTLHRSLLRYGLTFANQAMQTALANGRSLLEERLARWLLMAHDRVKGDELDLTHEFLATMLGVRRPGVTIALNLLDKSGLVAVRRGRITILDREGLEEASNGAYGSTEAEFRRMFDNS